MSPDKREKDELNQTLTTIKTRFRQILLISEVTFCQIA